MNYRSKKIVSILLGLLSGSGTILTAYLVARETPKANEKIKLLKDRQNVKKMDYVKALAPIYWPAGVVCACTIASTTISSIMSLKAQASLIATSTMLSQGWRQYKGKVKDILGVDAADKVDSSISLDKYNRLAKAAKSDGSQLFYEEHVGFFKCKKEDLIAGLSDLNQRLHTPDPHPKGTFYWTTLYFLLQDSNATLYDASKKEIAEQFGWTADYLCEVYDIGCMWVHPIFTKIVKKETGEVLFTSISFFEDPIYLESTERSRYHYKSRKDFEHEAEIDMHDADAFALYSHGYQDYQDEDLDSIDIQKELISTKPDCDAEDDDGRRFIPCKMSEHSEFLEDDEELSSLKDIPTLESIK